MQKAMQQIIWTSSNAFAFAYAMYSFEQTDEISVQPTTSNVVGVTHHFQGTTY